MRIYRATPAGRAVIGGEDAPLPSRYLSDLLAMCSRDMCERDLGQFMPPASLDASILRLLELGLIACDEAPMHAMVTPLAPRRRFTRAGATALVATR